jgi:hypothetical protein
MDSSLSRRRDQSTKSKTSFREAINDERRKTTVNIQDSYNKESFAIEVSLCTVDKRDGKRAYGKEIRY